MGQRSKTKSASQNETVETHRQWLVEKYESDRLRDRLLAIGLKLFVLDGPALALVSLFPTALLYIVLMAFPLEGFVPTEHRLGAIWALLTGYAFSVEYCFTTRSAPE